MTQPSAALTAPIAPGTVPALSSTAADLVQSSISANTQRAYSAALGRFDMWRASRPAASIDVTLADYVAELHSAGKSASTVTMAVAAIRFSAKLAGQPDPAGPLATRALAGARRSSSGRGRGQVTDVRWEQADAAAAVSANGGGSVSGLRDAAIIALASDALLRVSELAALTIGDLEAEGAGSIRVRRSKSDQEGKGTALFIGPATVARIQAWLAAAGITDQAAPLFQRLDKGGRVHGGISARSLRTIIAVRAADAGIEGRVSGHSLRVGSAQSLAAAGASLVDLQVAGRWKDPAMPAHYSRAQSAARGAVARLRYGGA